MIKTKLLIIAIVLLLIGLIGYHTLSSQYHIGRAGILKKEYAEIFIQAGHEGRTKGATGAESKFGRERDWTTVVADKSTEILEKAGITVIRSKADRRKYSVVDLAISIHFDGSVNPCASGASIGYDDITDKPAADEWKHLYSEYFHYKWHDDNFTRNLSHYYNFKYTITKDAELLLELGDITCEKQALWLKKNLDQISAVVAYFAASRIGKQHLLAKPNKF